MFEALTCSHHEDGISCRHSVKPPLTHSYPPPSLPPLSPLSPHLSPPPCLHLCPGVMLSCHESPPPPPNNKNVHGTLAPQTLLKLFTVSYLQGGVETACGPWQWSCYYVIHDVWSRSIVAVLWAYNSLIFCLNKRFCQSPFSHVAISWVGVPYGRRFVSRDGMEWEYLFWRPHII